MNYRARMVGGSLEVQRVADRRNHGDLFVSGSRPEDEGSERMSVNDKSQNNLRRASRHQEKNSGGR